MPDKSNYDWNPKRLHLIGVKLPLLAGEIRLRAGRVRSGQTVGLQQGLAWPGLAGARLNQLQTFMLQKRQREEETHCKRAKKCQNMLKSSIFITARNLNFEKLLKFVEKVVILS